MHSSNPFSVSRIAGVLACLGLMVLVPGCPQTSDPIQVQEGIVDPVDTVADLTVDDAADATTDGTPDSATDVVDADAAAETTIDKDHHLLVPASLCPKSARRTVDYVVDGDTVALQGGDGEHVRFLGVDAPEMNYTKPALGPECGAQLATDTLKKLLPKGTSVCLVFDPKSGDKDMYDRLLRWVVVDRPEGLWLVNAWMVRIGLAWVYYGFVEGTKFEDELVAAEDAAWSEGAGSWKACSW